MITTDYHGPDKLMESNAVRNSRRGNCLEPFANIGVCLVQQPLSQVALNLCRSKFQSMRCNLAEVTRTFRL